MSFLLSCVCARVCARARVRVRVRVCDYLRFLRKDAGSLASSVLTRPNSCMTLSSCLRSSWPFSRNMNSWPLLPAEGAAETHTQPSGTRRRSEKTHQPRQTTCCWRRPGMLALLLLLRQKVPVSLRLIKGTCSGCSPLSLT